jgi:hypothetical protein
VTGAVTARIINVSVAEGGIDVTINRGTDHGLADGAKARVQGIKNPEVTLKSCTNRSCRAFVRATTDEVSGKSVTVGQ